MTQKDKMTNPDNDEKMEQLAAIEHERWADWQKHMHAKITPSADDGICLIGEEWVRRWEKQIKTPYSELTEQEKESDREQVRRYWHLIVELQQQSHAAGYKEGSRETAKEILNYSEPFRPDCYQDSLWENGFVITGELLRYVISHIPYKDRTEEYKEGFKAAAILAGELLETKIKQLRKKYQGEG